MAMTTKSLSAEVETKSGPNVRLGRDDEGKGYLIVEGQEASKKEVKEEPEKKEKKRKKEY